MLNSAPVVDVLPADQLADPARARAWLPRSGGLGTQRDCGMCSRSGGRCRPSCAASAPRPRWPRPCGARPRSRYRRRPHHLASRRPRRPRPRRPRRPRLGRPRQGGPGPLRPCANDVSLLVLVDRSKTNTAPWCSMAVCGNLMKARRYYQRSRAQLLPTARHPPSPPRHRGSGERVRRVHSGRARGGRAPDWRSPRVHAARLLAGIAGQDPLELAARVDAQLDEDLAQVVLDGAGADEQPGSRSRGWTGRRAPAGRPGPPGRSARRRPGRDACGGSLVPPDRLAGGHQLAPGPPGERLHAHRVKHLVGGPQLLAGVTRRCSRRSHSP